MGSDVSSIGMIKKTFRISKGLFYAFIVAMITFVRVVSLEGSIAIGKL